MPDIIVQDFGKNIAWLRDTGLLNIPDLNAQRFELAAYALFERAACVFID